MSGGVLIFRYSLPGIGSPPCGDLEGSYPASWKRITSDRAALRVLKPLAG